MAERHRRGPVCKAETACFLGTARCGRAALVGALVLLWAAAAQGGVLFGGGPAQPSVIGNWEKSDQTWNDSAYQTLATSLASAGHTVAPDAGISPETLAGYDLLVIGEAREIPSGATLTELSSWIHNGGVLLLFADSFGSGVATGNAILTGVGSALSYGGATTAGPPLLAGGVFATTGPPYDIVGAALEVGPGTAVENGNDLAGEFARYERLGAGFVFAFGDRVDHDVFTPNGTTVNGKLFLNTAALPDPATFGLLAAGILPAFCRRRR